MRDKSPIRFFGGFIAGVVFCAVAMVGYIYLPRFFEPAPPSVPLETLVARIVTKEIKVVEVSYDVVTITDKQNKVFQLNVKADDAFRDQIFSAVKDTETTVILRARPSWSNWWFPEKWSRFSS